MFDLINRGGWALWVITLCSVISMAVTLERWIALRKANVNWRELLGRLTEALSTYDVQKAIDICHRTSGPLAETMAAGLQKLLLLEEIGKRPEEIEPAILEAMEAYGGQVVDSLERNLTILATVASLAPILGMTGTVFGMIRAFGSIHKSGSMTPEAVAGGISEALLCTAGGLIIAALATVEYNYFTARVNRFVVQLQAAGTVLVEKILLAQSRARRAGEERLGAARLAPARRMAEAFRCARSG